MFYQEINTMSYYIVYKIQIQNSFIQYGGPWCSLCFALLPLLVKEIHGECFSWQCQQLLLLCKDSICLSCGRKVGEGGGRRVGREEERKQGVVGVGGGDNLGVVS